MNLESIGGTGLKPDRKRVTLQFVWSLGYSNSFNSPFESSPLGYAVGMLHQFRCVGVLSQRQAVAGSPPG